MAMVKGEAVISHLQQCFESRVPRQELSVPDWFDSLPRY